MKTLSHLLLCAVALLTCGCKKPIFERPIVDWAPVVFGIIVEDSDGNDLLNPSSDNFLASRVEFDWCDKTFVYDYSTTPPITRAYLAKLTNPELRTQNGRYMLCFGEIAGDKTHDEDLTISWPDGSVDIIHYHNRVNHYTLKADRTFALNGTECSNPIIIVK